MSIAASSNTRAPNASETPCAAIFAASFAGPESISICSYYVIYIVMSTKMGAVMAGENTASVKIVADASGVKPGVDQAKNEVAGLEPALAELGANLKAMTGSFNSGFEQLATIMAGTRAELKGLEAETEREMLPLRGYPSGAIGSPRVTGSTRSCRSGNSVGSIVVSGLRPPPGRRTRSRGGGGASPHNSFNARPMMLHARPVILATAMTPPRPALRASAAAKRRRPLSSRSGSSASKRCLIAASSITPGAQAPRVTLGILFPKTIPDSIHSARTLSCEIDRKIAGARHGQFIDGGASSAGPWPAAGQSIASPSAD